MTEKVVRGEMISGSKKDRERGSEKTTPRQCERKKKTIKRKGERAGKEEVEMCVIDR